QFGIAASGQAMARGGELGLEFRILEKLAVLSDPDRAVLIADRLAPAGKVDDRQPPRPQSQTRFDVNLLVIRTTMRYRTGHRQKTPGSEVAATVQIKRSSDTAHRKPLSPKAVGTTPFASRTSARPPKPSNYITRGIRRSEEQLERRPGAISW